jgi:single-strand selective monofunctional uracil DNA glycosylase
MDGGTAERMVKAARALSRAVDKLSFGAPVGAVYNPLAYARAAHEDYLSKYAAGPKRVLVLGMNPGPWGMAQTGVPFGEISVVRDWLGVSGKIGRPPAEHPRVPVTGFDCHRSEVSGRRLWGLVAEHYGSADSFRRDAFVTNYCPLLFLDDAGRNLTPDRLTRAERDALAAVCDRFLALQIRELRPAWLVGVGKFALQCLERVRGEATARVVSIPHPSPANPAANRDWASQARAALEGVGTW